MKNTVYQVIELSTDEKQRYKNKNYLDKVNNTLPIPNPNELPTDYSDRLGRVYISQRPLQGKKDLAQYFTHTVVANFMSDLFTNSKKDVYIADPGAGVGILSCALCQHLANTENSPKNIYLTVYEIDEEVIVYLESSLGYLKQWLKAKGIDLKYQIVTQDFIMTNGSLLDNTLSLFQEFSSERQRFDYIISNPPYFKLSKSDPRARVALSVIHGQPNIYALFMAISAHMLRQGGEMVFITPRSYTAGPYFRLFRERFFSLVKPIYIHVFNSRKKAFDRDDVLQENIILKAKRDDLSQRKVSDSVTISFSEGISDLSYSNVRNVPLSEVINFDTKNKIVRIPLSEEGDGIAKLVHSWDGSLSSHGIHISTGPIVPFRAKEFISSNGEIGDEYAPLLWMQNVKPMKTSWPIESRKQQYIKINVRSKKLLLKNSNYVLIRRFSAKEERRRLVAAPFLAKQIKMDLVGIENHLNYIHKPQGELTEQEVVGLAALFNCKLMDEYFRTFSGNTQVSATEIRDMPLPYMDVIKKIGEHLIKTELNEEEMSDWIHNLLTQNAK